MAFGSTTSLLACIARPNCCCAAPTGPARAGQASASAITPADAGGRREGRRRPPFQRRDLLETPLNANGRRRGWTRASPAQAHPGDEGTQMGRFLGQPRRKKPRNSELITERAPGEGGRVPARRVDAGIGGADILGPDEE